MPLHWLRRSPRWAWLVLVVALVGADQATKAHFAATIPLGTGIELTPWLNLVHVLNTGAAFSLLADADGWQRPFLIAVGLIVVVAISFVSMTRHVEPMERWLGAVIVAGGAGNLIDRVQTGAVVDFLDLHWRGLHWPAFNLADVFVVTAVVAWALLSLRRPAAPVATPDARP